jgi:DNA-binding transcriptional ArsR family regulator
MSREVDAVFAALSDPTRREVVRCISEGGPVTATELAERIPISRQAIVKHLASLEEAGLVDSTVEGRSRRFRLTPGPMREAMGWMADVGAEWDDRLEALRWHLSSRRG